MQLFDLSSEELKVYNPFIYKADDFNNFWDRHIKEAVAQNLNLSIEDSSKDIPGFTINDIYYDGYKNSRIHARYIKSVNTGKNVPVVVIYHVYN